MNPTLKITTALGFALAIGLTATSPSFAKAHNQGFGSGDAGQLTSHGAVGAGQKNVDQTKEGSYGIRDTLGEVAAGTQDNKEAAQDRSEGSGHPSTKQ